MHYWDNCQFLFHPKNQDVLYNEDDYKFAPIMSELHQKFWQPGIAHLSWLITLARDLILNSLSILPPIYNLLNLSWVQAMPGDGKQCQTSNARQCQKIPVNARWRQLMPVEARQRQVTSGNASVSPLVNTQNYLVNYTHISCQLYTSGSVC